MMRRALVWLLLLVVAGVFAGREVLRLWEAPLNISAQGYRLTVAPGDTLAAVSRLLHEDGVLAHPRLLLLYGRFTGLDASIKQGEYLVPQFSTAASVLDLLQSGRVIFYQVTLPEGITLRQALEILWREPGLQRELSGPDAPELTQLVAPREITEGLFFPDSYQYTRGASDLSILRRAHRMMSDALEQEWQGRAEGLPYGDAYEALIMASIVEKETGLAQERGEIAGVFVRRLQRGMRLQTDPTVIYGIGPLFDGNLTRRHLADESNPYNTYRHRGLPPSPIALPGRAALHASLHPAPGSTLYFVARGDGGHVFSETLAEHQKAVRKYQLRRRKDYRSSPAAGDQ